MHQKLLVVPLTAITMLFATVVSAEMTVDEMELIDEGFKVFTEEEFDGNGRTCATCHVPGESYNIFPATIEKMDDDEKALVFATNVPGLENVTLIESHALFNISGRADTCPADSPSCFGEPGEEHSGPIFRSTMGIFAQELTSVNLSPGFPGTPLLPAKCSDGVATQLEQLGWAGDGAPGTPIDDPDCKTHHGIIDPDADGSLRAFANGAIAQHNTRSLNRTLGVDFRFATGDELDAMEAFQNWLGRRALTDDENEEQGTTGELEFDVNLLDFTDDRVKLARDFFVGPFEIFNVGPNAGVVNPNAGAGCNGCHENGGSNSIFTGRGNNITFITDVELAADDIGIPLLGVPLPHDEGASLSFGAPGRPPVFEEAFNTQSIIESSQKKAWFHNHRNVGDFEEAIEFYGSDDFALGAAFTSLSTLQNGSSLVAFPNGDGIEHLGAFLRTLNAFYNLRNCERLIDEAINRVNAGVSPKIAVKHCRFDLANAKRVLRESKLPNLHADIIDDLKFVHLELGKNEKLKKADVDVLRGLKVIVRDLRDSIAKQPEVVVAEQ